MNVKDILDRLPGFKKTSNGWQAKCPAHGDKNPSLTISEGAEGRILLHCLRRLLFGKRLRGAEHHG